jgi:hypothetical protein
MECEDKSSLSREEGVQPNQIVTFRVKLHKTKHFGVLPLK